MFEGKYSRILLAFLLGHLVVWTAIPAMIQPNLPLDCIEMAIWGHEWQLGYYKHPPLPAWIAKAFSSLSDNSEWPIYLASQICTVITMWCVWCVARVITPRPIAALAVVSLELSYYFTLTTPEFNNNIVSRCCWAITISSLFFGVLRQQPRYWMLAGLGLGLGMLSKYDTALLAMAILGFALFTQKGRSCWRTSGPWLLLAISLVVFLPHLIWVAANDFPTFRYFLARSGGSKNWFDHLEHPSKFFIAQLLAIGPSIASCWWWTRRHNQLSAVTLATSNIDPDPHHPTGSHELWIRQYLLLVTLVPCGFVLLLSLITGAKILTMWGAPMWTFAPLTFLVVTRAHHLSWKEQQLWPSFTVVSLIFVAIFTTQRMASPYVLGKGSRVNFPGEQLAQEIDRIWARNHTGSPPIIAGPWWTAGNVAFYLPGQSRVYVDLDPEKSLWLNDQAFLSAGGMIVWEAGEDADDFAAQIKARFPNAQFEPSVIVNWSSSSDIAPLQFHIAMLESQPAELPLSDAFSRAFQGTLDPFERLHPDPDLTPASFAIQQAAPTSDLNRPRLLAIDALPDQTASEENWLRNVQLLFDQPVPTDFAGPPSLERPLRQASHLVPETPR